MIPFSAPVDDILFTLEQVVGAPGLPGWDTGLARELVTYFAEFAENEIAPVNATGDAEGCRLEAGQVRLPARFGDVYRLYAEQGWSGLTIPEGFGGQGIGELVNAAVSEIFSGACHALQMSCGLLPGAIRMLLLHGTASQQHTFLPQIAAGDCLSTMCLTEPEAGSDLSAIRTRATPDGDRWRLNGEKIFISGGGQDLTDQILHLVLARSDDAPGIAGLSLFLCPDRGADGEKNGVEVLRLEEKTGLHGSPTCHLAFNQARAELLGEAGRGLQTMFTMMNHARIDVALQGVAHAARAAAITRAYAVQRRQGKRADGTPACLADHADVRRMLETQDALALGARAMCLQTLVLLESGEHPELVQLLTPVCKLFASEAGIEAADLGIQVLGGYGYLREYGVEQEWRDARITAIYEGANGIHSMALATRMLRVNEGLAAAAYDSYLAGLLGPASDADDLREGLACWRAARARLLRSAEPGESAHAFARLTAELFYRAMWQKLAAATAAAPNPQRIMKLARRVARSARAKFDYWGSQVI